MLEVTRATWNSAWSNIASHFKHLWNRAGAPRIYGDLGDSIRTQATFARSVGTVPSTQANFLLVAFFPWGHPATSPASSQPAHLLRFISSVIAFRKLSMKTQLKSSTPVWGLLWVPWAATETHFPPTTSELPEGSVLSSLRLLCEAAGNPF